MSTQEKMSGCITISTENVDFDSFCDILESAAGTITDIKCILGHGSWRSSPSMYEEYFNMSSSDRCPCPMNLVLCKRICRVLQKLPASMKSEDLQLTIVHEDRLESIDHFELFLDALRGLPRLRNLRLELARGITNSPSASDIRRRPATMFDSLCQSVIAAPPIPSIPFNFMGLPVELQAIIIEMATISTRSNTLLNLNKPFTVCEMSPTQRCCGYCGWVPGGDCRCPSIEVYRPSLFAATCICRKDWPQPLFQTNHYIREMAEKIYFSKQAFCIEGTLPQIHEHLLAVPDNRVAAVRDLSILVHRDWDFQHLSASDVVQAILTSCDQRKLHLALYVYSPYWADPFPSYSLFGKREEDERHVRDQFDQAMNRMGKSWISQGRNYKICFFYDDACRSPDSSHITIRDEDGQVSIDFEEQIALRKLQCREINDSSPNVGKTAAFARNSVQRIANRIFLRNDGLMLSHAELRAI